MRGLACFLVVAASAMASAHPSQPLNGRLGSTGMPHPRPPPPPPGDLLDMPRPVPPDPCGTGKTWKVIDACLKKQGATKLVYDTATLKVVQIPFGDTSNSSRLWLFVQTESGSWNRASFTGYTNAQTELLSIVPYSSEVGVGLRLDLGNTMRTTLLVEQGSVTRGIVRRVNTTVCLPTAWSCRTITTGCDAYLRGRLLWSYQAQIVWKPAIGLRLHVDSSRAGGMCTPLKSMVDETE